MTSNLSQYFLLDRVIGFDPLADLIGAYDRSPRGSPYPACDVEKISNDHYALTVVVAGFSQDELSISTRDNRLVVSGRKNRDFAPKGDFIHQEIDTNNFQRVFQLAEHISVAGAALKDGLLRIDLVQELPEELKPRRIEIKTDATALRLESNENQGKAA